MSLRRRVRRLEEALRHEEDKPEAVEVFVPIGKFVWPTQRDKLLKLMREQGGVCIAWSEGEQWFAANVRDEDDLAALPADCEVEAGAYFGSEDDAEWGVVKRIVRAIVTPPGVRSDEEAPAES